MVDAQKQALIRSAVKQDTRKLHAIFCDYIIKLGLAVPEGVEGQATELLNDVVVVALEKADTFDPERLAVPWLLGIGLNLLKRRRSDLARSNKHMIPIRDLYRSNEAQFSDDELFERFAEAAPTADEFESSEWIQQVLAPLTEADRTIIRLAVLHELDSAAIAQQLNISQGAVRVRLHRALKRLRASFRFQHEEVKYG